MITETRQPAEVLQAATAELGHFDAQMKGAAVPGTALVRALNAVVEGGVADTEQGQGVLRRIAGNFAALAEHHARSAEQGLGDWHNTWANFSRSKAEMIADTLLKKPWTAAESA